MTGVLVGTATIAGGVAGGFLGIQLAMAKADLEPGDLQARGLAVRRCLLRRGVGRRFGRGADGP